MPWVYTRCLPLSSHPFTPLSQKGGSSPLTPAAALPPPCIYVHNLWGSKNAKKLISRPHHRRLFVFQFPVLFSAPAVHHVHPPLRLVLCGILPSALSPGPHRSLVPLSRLLAKVHINFYLVCYNIHNILHDILSLSLVFISFNASSSCHNFISWPE